MHEREKWKWIRSVGSNPQRPHGLQPSRFLRLWDFPGKSTGVGCHCLLRAISLSTFKTLFAPWTSNQCKDSINSSDNETLSFYPVLGILLGAVYIMVNQIQAQRTIPNILWENQNGKEYGKENRFICITESLCCTKINTILIYNIYCIYLHFNSTPLQYSCLENPMDGGAW